MKVTTTKNPPVFAPVSMVLTFENQRELDLFASLFNTTLFCSAARASGVPIIAPCRFEEIGGDPRKFCALIQDSLLKKS